jgi:hypothetical protein
MTEIEVEKICKKYKIENWTLNPDGAVDVEGNVDLANKGLRKLPLKFGRVTGNFWCSYNQLTSLEGCPTEIGGSFWCFDNLLTSLEGCPTEIGGSFLCYYNQLTSLEGCPTEIGGIFICYNNNLTSLKGATEYIEGGVEFMPNDKLPEYIKQIIRLNDGRYDIQKYILKWQKEYDIWRRDGSFNQDRFILMMQDAGDELGNLKFI